MSMAYADYISWFIWSLRTIKYNFHCSQVGSYNTTSTT